MPLDLMVFLSPASKRWLLSADLPAQIALTSNASDSGLTSR
jgi:hypothetical protein